MSTQQNEKVYVNGMFVKTQKTTFGDIIKISVKVETINTVNVVISGKQIIA